MPSAMAAGPAMDGDALVGDYLARLRTSAEALPGLRRAELEAEVAEHIETALETAGSRDELTVRNVLERLGPPADIIAAEFGASRGQESVAGQMRPAIERSRWGPIEILAVLFLLVGGFVIPIIGPLVGLVLAWFSSQWTRREKVIATVIATAIVGGTALMIGLPAIDLSTGPITHLSP